MKLALVLALFGTALSALPASSQSSSTRSNTKKSTTKSSRQTNLVSSSSSKSHKSSKRGRTKHGPPPPSYQLHPDPERYRQIQQALTDRGYFKGQVDGQWGDDSVDALKRFQTDQKLEPDGKINALSLISLGLGPKHDGSTAQTGVTGAPAIPPTPDANNAPPE